MHRTAVLAATALLALVLAVLAHLASSPLEAPASPAPAPAVAATLLMSSLEVTEDQPGWDCATTGNLQCGVGSPAGPVLHPADGGDTTYSCPQGSTGPMVYSPQPEMNELGQIVCNYARNI